MFKKEWYKWEKKKVEWAVEIVEAASAEAAVGLVAADPAKCTMQSVQTVVSKRKCRSSLPKADRYIAEIVTRSIRNSKDLHS